MHKVLIVIQLFYLATKSFQVVIKEAKQLNYVWFRIKVDQNEMIWAYYGTMVTVCQWYVWVIFLAKPNMILIQLLLLLVTIKIHSEELHHNFVIKNIMAFEPNYSLLGCMHGQSNVLLVTASDTRPEKLGHSVTFLLFF